MGEPGGRAPSAGMLAAGLRTTALRACLGWQAGCSSVPGPGSSDRQSWCSPFSGELPGSREPGFLSGFLFLSPKDCLSHSTIPACGLGLHEEMQLALAFSKCLCSLPFGWVGVGVGGVEMREDWVGREERRQEGGD